MAQLDYLTQQKLLEAIDRLVEGRLKNLSFNYCVEGNIASINTDGTYDVRIDGEVYSNINSISAESYELNNVVSVLIVNSKWENKKILCKVKG